MSNAGFAGTDITHGTLQAAPVQRRSLSGTAIAYSKYFLNSDLFSISGRRLMLSCISSTRRNFREPQILRAQRPALVQDFEYNTVTALTSLQATLDLISG